MCAINPTHKKRFVIDVYTSLPMTQQDFLDLCLESLTLNELDLNTKWPELRYHLKESEQQAD